ncbi:GNAT family N-acetyltransferase [Streptomyces sp. NPDC102381]|uniref:GNAT family N-acetyltransferase n=1 Tax=Streptomyces sp. NPDC102381 TaxID=3366164 RepID=UPI00381DA4D6
MRRRTGGLITTGDGTVVMLAEQRPGADGQWRISARTQAGRQIAEVRFRLCEDCAVGRIQGIWVDESWRREGIGHELLRGAIAVGDGFRWTTTLQSSMGRRFFVATGATEGVELLHGRPLCAHMMGRWGRAWARRAAA